MAMFLGETGGLCEVFSFDVVLGGGDVRVAKRCPWIFRNEVVNV